MNSDDLIMVDFIRYTLMRSFGSFFRFPALNNSDGGIAKGIELKGLPQII